MLAWPDVGKNIMTAGLWEGEASLFHSRQEKESNKTVQKEDIPIKEMSP